MELGSGFISLYGYKIAYWCCNLIIVLLSLILLLLLYKGIRTLFRRRDR